VAKFHDAARVSLENENHSAPNLSGRHCHCDIPVLGSRKRPNHGANGNRRSSAKVT
jgi:hypothetical protein